MCQHYLMICSFGQRKSLPNTSAGKLSAIMTAPFKELGCGSGHRVLSFVGYDF